MRLDWDCARAILLALEEKLDTGSAIRPDSLGNWDAETVSWHMLKLQEAGYIKAACREQRGVPVHCVAFDLTIQGSELLGNLSCKGVWGQLCSEARTKGLALTFGVVKTLAEAAVARILKGG